MAIDPRDLIALSPLLDQALALPMADRDAWLAALPAEQQRHVPALRGMLARHDSTRAGGYLAAGARVQAVDESVAHAGEIVGAYRLLREIGRGGMGSVWLAERADGAFERQVALKLPRLAWGTGLAERMARERRIGALLEHPHIARLYDAGVDARGRPFIAMEYVEGVAIDVYVRQQALAVREVLHLMLQIIRAVAYAHGRLVVHRDLKPGNVLVSADGQAHLLDFGIAKLLDDEADPRLTQEQGRAMTLNYAAPEQIAGRAVGVQADVYALGVVLYELLTGTLPHVVSRSTAGAIEEAILQGDLTPASSRVAHKPTVRALRGELDAVLAKALQRDPPQRYATADALADDIERHLAGLTVRARRSTPLQRVLKAARRHRVAVLAGVAVTLAVLGGATAAAVQARRANAEADRARVVKAFVVDVFKVNASEGSNRELRKLPAEMLVEHGARLIEQRFPQQPHLQAELNGVVAGLFLDLGAPRLAVDHARRQLAALAVLEAGAESRGQALLLLARGLFDERRYTEANAELRRAIGLLGDRADQIEPRLAAQVLLARGLLELGQMPAGETELAAVEASLRRSPADHRVVHAEARRLRAYLLTRANRFDEAQPVYQEAVALALAAQGPDSALAVELRLSLARALLNRGEGRAAQAPMQAALAALRASGVAGTLRAAIEESRLTWGLFESGDLSYEQARRVVQANRDEVTLRGTLVPASVSARLDFAMGVIEGLWGNVADGHALLARAAPQLDLATEDLLDRFVAASNRGMLAMQVGEHALADSQLRERRALRQQRGRGQTPFAAQDHALIALNLGMQHRHAEGLALLADAPQFDAERGDAKDGALYARRVPVARVRLLLDQGDVVAAQSGMPAPGADTPESATPQERFLDAERLLRGELMCASGQHAEGLRWLRHATDNAGHLAAEHHPELARARAITGLCLLAMGQRAGARALAAQVRIAFTIQPGVSPYYKAPLQRLEQALGLRLPPV